MVNLTRGERFKDARLIHNQHGWQSMEEVYSQTGVSASMIKDLEDDDKTRSVGYDKVVLLAKHYGVSTDYLLGLSSRPKVTNDFDYVCEYTGLSKDSIESLLRLKKIYKESWPLDTLDVLEVILENEPESNLLTNISLLWGIDLNSNDCQTIMLPVEYAGDSAGVLEITQDDIYSFALNKIEKSLCELSKHFAHDIRMTMTDEPITEMITDNGGK